MEWVELYMITGISPYLLVICVSKIFDFVKFAVIELNFFEEFVGQVTNEVG